MKRRVLLPISIGLNLALATALLAVWQRKPAPVFKPVYEPSAPIAAVAVANTNASVPVLNPNAAAVAPVFHWGLIESGDYFQYVANLRAIRCPPRTVEDIILADVNVLYQGRRTVFERKAEPWQGQDVRSAARQRRMEQMAETGREKAALLKELLGRDFVDRSDLDDRFGYNEATILLSFLSEEKQVRLCSLLDATYRRRDDVFRAANHILIDEDFAKLKAIQNELNIETAGLLTPAEREELEGRAQLEIISSGGGVYLEGVELTGFEMRQISLLSRSVRNAMDEVSIYMADEQSEEEEERRKIQFQERVADLLGKRRLADLARAQDERFRGLWSFAHESKISRPNTIKVYEARQSAEAQVEQITADESLSPEQRAAALLVLQGVTQKRVAGLLGPAAYQKYTSEAGQWLNKLGGASDERVTPQ